MSSVLRHVIIPAVHLLLRDPVGRVLLLRRAGTGYADGSWSLPAGHLDPGERSSEAMLREAAEEIGVQLEAGQLRMALAVQRRAPDSERIDFFYAASGFTGRVINLEPHKCDRLEWHDPAALPEPMVGYVRAAIEAWLEGETYLEYGWAPGED